MAGLIDSITKSLDVNLEDMFTGADSIIHDDIYKLNRDCYEGYQWVAALDSYTCIVAGECIDTPDGERKIEDIAVGDYVTGGSGVKRKVTGKKEKEVDEYLEIEFTDGSTLKITADQEIGTIEGWIEGGSLHEGTKIKTVL
jgi:hypothetical protein